MIQKIQIEYLKRKLPIRFSSRDGVLFRRVFWCRSWKSQHHSFVHQNNALSLQLPTINALYWMKTHKNLHLLATWEFLDSERCISHSLFPAVGSVTVCRQIWADTVISTALIIGCVQFWSQSCLHQTRHWNLICQKVHLGLNCMFAAYMQLHGPWIECLQSQALESRGWKLRFVYVRRSIGSGGGRSLKMPSLGGVLLTSRWLNSMHHQTLYCMNQAHVHNMPSPSKSKELYKQRVIQTASVWYGHTLQQIVQWEELTRHKYYKFCCS